MNRTRHLLVVLAGCTLVATGCSGSSTSVTPSSAHASSTTSASSTTTSTTVPSSTTSVAPTTTTVAATAPCSSAVLSLAITSVDNAAGHQFTTISFTNNGASTCSLSGYPGVSNVNAAGVQLGAAADRDPRPPVTVILHGGEHTSVVVDETRVGIQAGCLAPATWAHATALRIYPPNQVMPLLLTRPTRVCRNANVHELVVTAVGVVP